jgi:glycosyltransferase involved in cell wall biosynthesis
VALRVVVVDDNPHLSWDGRIYPVNATFHQFLSAVLDVPGPGGSAEVREIVHCVPLRPATAAPSTLPLDPRLRVIGTAPFDGIAGYLRHAPALLRSNRPILGGAIEGADVAWIKTPASNAVLAATLAGRAGVARFAWVAGSATAVAAGQARSRPGAVGARAVGALYDAAGRLSAGGHRIVVGEDLLSGDGIVTSLVEPDEVRDRGDLPWPSVPWRLRLGWAGRLSPGKGLEALFTAVAHRVAQDGEARRTELVVLGDGPLSASLHALADELGIGEHIHWLGHVADRAPYLDALAACDLFVSASPAEGFPKTVLDAMAAGLPVLAAPSGQLAPLAAVGIVASLPDLEPEAIAAAVDALARDASQAHELRSAGSVFAAAHTRPAEAAHVVARWRSWWPELPWND